MKIYPKLEVSPKLILLPWDKEVKPTYIVRPQASGATGFYRWESLNPLVASLSYKPDTKESARATISTHGIGSSEIVVVDQYSSIFRDIATVSIQEIVDMQVIPGVLEGYHGSSIYVQLALYGEVEGKKRLFDDCSKIPLNFDIVESARFSYNEDPGDWPLNSRACRTVRFDCKSVGHSRVWINYLSPDGATNLTATSVISCFYPLKVVHPEKEGLLAVGTSMEMAFEGGPRKWPISENYYTRLIPSADKLVNIDIIRDPYRYKKDMHVFRVTCQDIGESKLELAIGNLPTAALPNPAVEKVEVIIICAVPTSLTLSPKMKIDENCPLNTNGNSKVPISNAHPVEIEISARDSKGRVFSNITSLKVDWTLSNYLIAKPASHRDFTEEVNGANGYRRWNRNFMLISPLNKKEGDLIISAKSLAYRWEVLNDVGLESFSKELPKPLTTDLSLTLVDKPRISPRDAVIYNHGDNKILLSIEKGSGHFHVEPIGIESGIVNATYFDTAKQIKVRPLSNGVISVKVVDSCVDHRSTGVSDAEASIRVIDPRAIRVTFQEKVELGQEAVAHVQIIDTSGASIPASFHSLMNLRPTIASDIISLRAIPPNDKETTSIFIAKAEKLGKGSLTFRTGSSDKTGIYSKIIVSVELVIEVYAPLKLHPSEIRTIPGGSIELTATGGPQPNTSILYSVDSKDIAGMTSSGFIEAKKVGTTKLSAKSVDKKSSQIYSQDEVPINVVPLHEIRVTASTKNLPVGVELPVEVFGIGPDGKRLPPFMFGSVNPDMKYKWLASEKEILVNIELHWSADGSQTLKFVTPCAKEAEASVEAKEIKVEEKESKQSPHFEDSHSMSDIVYELIYFPVTLLQNYLQTLTTIICLGLVCVVAYLYFVRKPATSGSSEAYDNSSPQQRHFVNNPPHSPFFGKPLTTNNSSPVRVLNYSAHTNHSAIGDADSSILGGTPGRGVSPSRGKLWSQRN